MIGAEAFTLGSHIHFAPGTDDRAGAGAQHLLAHELAHVVQQDIAVRRLFKFDATLDNQVSTWKTDALGAFSPAGQPDVVFGVADFVVANFERGDGVSPVPADFEFSAPCVGKRARDAATAIYDTKMLPLRVELTEKGKKLQKPRVKKIRTELQEHWGAIVQELGDDCAAGIAQLEKAAQRVADDILALQATKKVLKKDKETIADNYTKGCRYSRDEIIKQANLKAHAAKSQPAWKVNAKKSLTAEQYEVFDTERSMIEQRLAQWETKPKDGIGTNENGTFGTSFGGSGNSFKNNPLPQAVYNALLEWWKTVPGPTWSTPSLTTDYSLKKERVKKEPNLSPRFNYHIELAAA